MTDRQTRLYDSFDMGRCINPFLKWAGGKRRLAPSILTKMPPHRRYIEPFLGGGAVYFSFCPEGALLGDNNARLVRAYRAVAWNVEEVIWQLTSCYPVDKEFYLALRGKNIDNCSDIEVACWLIYLNKTGFNGLYRVNKAGSFNVPWGKYENPTVCNADGLRACSAVLRSAEIIHNDFERVAEEAKAGDLVYFDPPYVPISKDSSFTSYTKERFGADEQLRLRNLAKRLKERGVFIAITNSNAEEVLDLYSDGFEISQLKTTRNIAAKKESRGDVVDLLIT